MSIPKSVVDAWWGWIIAVTWQVALLTCLALLFAVLFRKAPPRIRHCVWLLVVLKVLIPTSFSTPWSAGNLLAPFRSDLTVNLVSSSNKITAETSLRHAASHEAIPSDTQSHAENVSLFTSGGLFGLWSIGMSISITTSLIQYKRLCRATSRMPLLDEGPVRIAVERAALKLNVASPPDIRLSNVDASPFLVGTLEPSVVVSKSLVDQASADELETVLMHELLHWKHRDTWIGWLQILVQSLLWFHPFMWLANSRLRYERELVCDEAVLREGGVKPDDYGRTLLRVLTVSRARPVLAGTHVGIFERGARIQNRLETVMQFEDERQTSLTGYALAVATFAILFLPMSASVNEDSVAAADVDSSTLVLAPPRKDNVGKTKTSDDATKKVAKPKTPYPQIIRTQPKAGATGVDPSIKEIRVTFDRDMGQGMSWTGGGPEFPPVDKSQEVR